jgi:putative ABC transport system permease protein
VNLPLLIAQLRDQPLRSLVTVFAIALGTALCASVYLVNGGALEEFQLAARRLVGEADLVVRAAHGGFDESLYPKLAALPGVETAGPALELDVALPASRNTLHVLGVDPFRSGAIQPELLGDVAGNLSALLERDGIFLSASAAAQLALRAGSDLEVIVGARVRRLRVLGVLPAERYPRPLGLMDIAAAQWAFERIGALDRIDLRLSPGTDAAALRRRIGQLLPLGVNLVAPQIERDRAANVTRAYRVNLNMLALVSLLTGAFLVFSTQSLSVLRRRSSLALLRAIGMRRGELERMLVGEALLLGLAGAILGVFGAVAIARAVLALLAGDLGNGQLAVSGSHLNVDPLAALAFVPIGTAVACLGAWVPAREAARRNPARALKSGDAEHAVGRARTAPAGLALLAAGAVLALLPAVGGLPVFGYLSIAALLFGGVLLVPAVASGLLRRAPRAGSAPVDVAIAQLRGSAGQSTISLAAIIVSFSLMIAMAIMVYSFRDSFERWLTRVLPADLQLRVATGSDTAYWDAAEQRAIASAAGVGRTDFRRSSTISLRADRPPVALVARDIDASTAAQRLTLVAAQAVSGPGPPPAWVSEAMSDLHGVALGSPLVLPLGGRRVEFRVAGIFRDYGRSGGSIVVPRSAYLAATGDAGATEASVWLAPRADSAAVRAAIRASLPAHSALEVRTSGEVRELSLRIFDRAFAVTYALEAIAVLIGLVGVSFASGSSTLSRRGEFGMLRHVGMLRSQVLTMLASEGLAMSAVGVLYGLALGAVLSLVLVFVVNRQSFGWSVDLAIPWLQIGAFSALLILAGAVTAIVSGRSAMGGEALRAVREDW